MDNKVIQKYVDAKPECRCESIHENVCKLKFPAVSSSAYGEWFIGGAGSLCFVVKEVYVPPRKAEKVKNLWDSMRTTSKIYLQHGEYPLCEIPEGSSYLIGFCSGRRPDEAFEKDLDRLLLECGLILEQFSASYTPAIQVKYSLKKLMSLANLLGPYRFDLRSYSFVEFLEIDGSKALSNELPTNHPHHRDINKENQQEDSWLIESGVSFEMVGGQEPLKEMVRKSVVWPVKNPGQAAKYRVSVPNGILLFGAPGCGKTYFAKAIAHECHCSFREVNSSEIGSMYVHDSANRIHQLFDEARKHAPAVLLFDEIDQFCAARGSDEMAKRNDEVSAFLTEMNNCGSDGVLVIGTTNRPEDLDPAIKRHGRLDLQIEMDAPSSKERMAILQRHLDGLPCEEMDIESLASMAEGLVASDLVYSVNTASLQAAIEDRRIRQEEIESALAECTAKTEKRRKIGYKN